MLLPVVWHEVFIVLAFCCGVMTSLTTLSVLASDLGRGSTVKHRGFFLCKLFSPCYFAGQQWRDDQIVMYKCLKNKILEKETTKINEVSENR